MRSLLSQYHSERARVMEGSPCPICYKPSEWLSTTNEWVYNCTKHGRFNRDGVLMNGGCRACIANTYPGKMILINKEGQCESCGYQVS